MINNRQNGLQSLEEKILTKAASSNLKNQTRIRILNLKSSAILELQKTILTTLQEAKIWKTILKILHNIHKIPFNQLDKEPARSARGKSQEFQASQRKIQDPQKLQRLLLKEIQDQPTSGEEKTRNKIVQLKIQV
jgi:hypothetical protein